MLSAYLIFVIIDVCGCVFPRNFWLFRGRHGEAGYLGVARVHGLSVHIVKGEVGAGVKGLFGIPVLR